MNQAQADYEWCKRIARDNTKCLSILLKVMGRDREDIIDQITEINKQQWDAITPQGIVSLFEKCNEDIDEFIKVYDKQMESAKYIRKNFYDGYEKGMRDYIRGN